MLTRLPFISSDVLQLQRLRKRDGLTEEQALQRIKSQVPMTEKVDRADIVLDNSSDLNQLEIQVKNMVKKIKPSTLTWLLEYAGPPAAIALFSIIVKQYAPILLRIIGDSIASLK
jgi:dephospho-CoA kinase